MSLLSILHLENDPESTFLVQQQFLENALEVQLQVVTTRAEYLTALEQGTIDLILSESQIGDFSGYAAFAIAQEQYPEIPFVFVYQTIDIAQAVACLHQGLVDCVSKDQIWRLGPLVQRLSENATCQPSVTRERGASAEQQEQWIQGMQRLITVVQDLSLARDLETITHIVRRAARELTRADGATFILRENDYCYYVDEDAISPLWKGRRLPFETCIGGWCMRSRQQVIIEDVYEDARIPIDAYRPTFVKSLVVVPIRTESPIGAIGTYWATHHTAMPEEVQLLQALADTTSVALENVHVYSELEERVRDRTAQLEAANQELKAFSYTLSHDLRTPLASLTILVRLLEAKYGKQFDQQGLAYLEQLRVNIQRIDTQIEEILMLHRVTQLELRKEVVNLTQMAQDVIANLQATEPERQVETTVQEGLTVYADPALLRVLLENLLSNAWKYTSKRSQPRIEVGRMPESQSAQVFYVRDNGAGFEMSQAAHLFMPFQRLHKQTEFPGTGIGLASVQRIVQKHGGQIWAKAAIEQGATFYVSLPQPAVQL